MSSFVLFLPSFEFVSENLDARQTAPPVPDNAKSLMIFTVRFLDTAI